MKNHVTALTLLGVALAFNAGNTSYARGIARDGSHMNREGEVSINAELRAAKKGDLARREMRAAREDYEARAHNREAAGRTAEGLRSWEEARLSRDVRLAKDIRLANKTRADKEERLNDEVYTDRQERVENEERADRDDSRDSELRACSEKAERPDGFSIWSKT